jgi:putative holliday junction resolvase
MPRIVAIDYGSKRTGIAVTDPLKIIATPLDTLHSKDLIDFFKKYHASEIIEKFVIGMPKKLDNSETNNTGLVVSFVNLLKKHFPNIPVVYIDERFTSSIALQTMIDGGMSKKDRQIKGNVDKISATIILQSYLEQQNI